MIEKKKHKVEIRVEDRRVELNVDGSVFKLSSDERGFPQFPESVRDDLPGSTPGIIVATMMKMKRDGRNQAQIYVDVLHQFTCAKLEEDETCDCRPVFRDSSHPTLETDFEQFGYGTLTCIVCHESSVGERSMCSFYYNDTALWYRLWTTGDDRRYWLFSSTILICEHCVINFMTENGVKFGNRILH